jgi:hypothetical protein
MRRVVALWPCLAVALALQVVWVGAGRAPDYRDHWEFHLPDHEVLGTQWRETGRLPAWNPKMECGSPAPGGYGRGLYYPPGWVAYLLPAPATLAWVVALHAALAAAGLLGLLRAWGLPRRGQVVGAVAYAGGGIVAGLWNYPYMAAAAAWLPFVLWGADAALRTGRLRWAALGGVALGLGVLAGDPHTSAMTGGLVLLLALVRIRARPLIALGTIVTVAVVAAGTAGPEILAGLEWLETSRRAGGLEAKEALGWSLRQRDALRLLVPFIWGDGIREWYGLPFMKPPSYLVGLAPGLGVLALAVAGLWRWRRPEVRFAILAALIFPAIAASPALGFGETLLTLPGFSWFRFPIKYVVGAAPALAILAASGATALEARGPRRAAAGTAGLLGLVLGGLGLVLGERLYLRLAGPVEVPELWAQDGPAAIATARTWLLVAGGTGLALGVALLLARTSRRRAVALGLLLLEPVVCSAWITAPGVMPEEPPPVVPVIRERARDGDPGRVAAVLDTRKIFLAAGNRPEQAALQHLQYLPWMSSLSYGLSTMNGYGSPRPAAWERLRQARPGSREDTDRWMYRLHEMSGVRFIVTPYKLSASRAELVAEPVPGVKVWELPGRLPRAYVSRRARPFPEAAALEQVLVSGDFDHHAEALVEVGADDEPFPAALARAPRAPHGPARIQEDLGVAVTVRAVGPGLLVLADTAYPGWTATVDGEPAPWWRTNGLFRGVALPPGEHDVVFRFVPTGMWPGLGILLGTLVVVGLACLRRRGVS